MTFCAASTTVRKSSRRLLSSIIIESIRLLRGCSNIKVGFQPTGFENSSPIDLRGQRSPELTRIHIPKCNTPHFTSHHHHKVTFPSIVINAPSYPAGRNVLHFKNVTLSVKMDHQTDTPRCIFSPTGRLSFHVFHCVHGFRSLKRPINKAAGRLQKQEHDPVVYLQRPLLVFFYGGDGCVVAPWASGSLRFFVVLVDCFGTNKTFKNGQMQLNISLCTKCQLR